MVVFGLIGFPLVFTPATFASTVPKVSLVVGDSTSKPLQHGLSKLKLALQQKGVLFEDAESFRAAKGDAIVAGQWRGSKRPGKAAEVRK